MPALLLATSPWLALPLGLLGLLSSVGLLKSIIALSELYNPSENFYALAASQPAFRFQLTRPGTYEVAGARPGQLNGRVVDLPAVRLCVRQLATGHEQHFGTGSGGPRFASDLGGDPAATIGTFVALAPGEYELLNPDAANFRPTDRLRILPTTAGKSFLLILALLFTGIGTLGGFIGALLAGLGPRA
jgi:hypothetical protein